MNVCAVGIVCYIILAATKTNCRALDYESRCGFDSRWSMQVHCISDELMQSLDVGHGYLLRVVGNLVQGRRLYAINGFGVLPSTTLPVICYFSSHLSLYCARQREKFGRVPQGHRDRRLAAGHSPKRYITTRLRQRSYPYSHIANRSKPETMLSISVRDTLKRSPHVVVVVASAPNGSSWPLHSRHDTSVTW
jgi:hypothetical protein